MGSCLKKKSSGGYAENFCLADVPHDCEVRALVCAFGKALAAPTKPTRASVMFRFARSIDKH